MTPLVPIMLIGWVPFTIFLFFTLKPHRAVLISVIGGWLLLPQYSYSFQGIPSYGSSAAIALGLILGGWLSGHRQKANFQWKIYDLPMIMWCFSAIPTSLTNQLGIYDGISATFGNIVAWGIPYLAGRIYFKDSEALRDLCLGIMIGGLLYLPLCLYEIRMSPRLNITLYGFFPHEWRQHFRYGGWRPIVFMQHGLMVALWMAIATTVAFWLWRSRTIKHIKGVPMAYIFIGLMLTTILSKSANGWFTLALGCGLYFVYRKSKTNLPFVLLILTIPLYLLLRMTEVISVDNVTMVAAHIFDAERVGSLQVRLTQEDLFVRHTLSSPLFGWGGHSRGWPVDPETGQRLIKMVDAMWIIHLSRTGFFGLVAFLTAMLIGPWLALRSAAKVAPKEDSTHLIPVVMSLVVILFMIDSLFNGMRNPAYILSSGALVSWYLASQKQPQQHLSPAAARMAARRHNKVISATSQPRQKKISCRKGA